MIQLIDKQKLLFRIENIKFHYIKPKYLQLHTPSKPIIAVVKNGSMYWNVKGHQISYNNLKKLLKNEKSK